MVAARVGVTKINRLLGSMNVYSKFDVNLVNLSGIFLFCYQHIVLWSQTNNQKIGSHREIDIGQR